jgi:hypothetical protein
LTVAPNNAMLSEIKSVYLFLDPSSYGSETTRELLYTNFKFLQYSFMRDFLKIVNKNDLNLPINFNLISNYFIHLLGTSGNSNMSTNSSDLYKSQYRPMKKGIVNMIRLQATNAIAMPTEIRLHILASSKDVIHS